MAYAFNEPLYTPQPNIGFVDFIVGGVSITLPDKSEGRPQRLQDFSYVRKAMNCSNMFMIKVIDTEWIVVENLLVQGRTEVKFKYYVNGPGGGLQSPMYHGLISNFTTNFAVDHCEISIEGYSMGTEANEIKRCGSYKNKKISEIVKEICDRNGWNCVIDETQSVKQYEGFTDTKIRNKVWTQNQVSDLQFIKETLLPYAVRDSDKVAGYKIFFDDKRDENGKITLHFHPPRIENKVFKSYKFMRNDPYTPVISFAPEIPGHLKFMYGAGSVSSLTFDHITQDINKNTVNQQTTPEKTALSNKTIEQVVDQKCGVGKKSFTSASSASDGKKLSKQMFYSNFNALYKAEMVIHLDTRLSVMDVINIQVILPSGLPHYSSGNYLIMEITDSIPALTSTLQLFRNSSKEGECKVIGTVNGGALGHATRMRGSAISGSAVAGVSTR